MTLSTAIHPNDDMFSGSLEHYENCGIEFSSYAKLIKKDNNHEDFKVLELPCGYGRVTRHLVEIFKPEQITSADIMGAAVDFTASTFGVNGFKVSEPANEFKGIEEKAFDLAMMGSLITHFSENNTKVILENFLKKINDSGVAIITTHGQRAFERMINGDWFEITDNDYSSMKSAFESGRFGFANYSTGHSFEKKTVDEVGDVYGVSLIPHQWMVETLSAMGYEVIKHVAAGWDNHQDVYFIKRAKK
ncbi:MAG: class I SAM-dependent methyltransferase [Rouxiella aceris]|uniref:class I SAM-dependent methyltransferase n=1 Tax=Rouxiella aceris TaxID=2703884 RepID=UPI002849EAE8|nr:class I SAM-dependent methyltransferase [Rouxiella aceris]MDR3432051.1 class I SAM-dependent methyltransferase [Rouxiella aceris]